MTHRLESRSRARGRTRTLSIVAIALTAAVTLTGCAGLSQLPGFSWLAGSQSADGSGSDEPKPLPETPQGTVAGFGAQEPKWQSCGGEMLCADVYAPLDWEDPAGETITLSLVKHEATGSDRLGTLFINPGGPGASGVDFVQNNFDYAVQPELQRSYDVIGWDPRGVGASTPVQCLDAAGMDAYLYGPDSAAGLERGSDAWIDAALAEEREFGAACAETSGDLIQHVSTGSTVQDLDMLRAIAGDPKLNYLGFSYGTYIGARYADAYPERVGRLVLDGAMDPSADMNEVVRAQTLGFEQALRAYVTDCLNRRGCPLTGSVDAAMAQIGKLLDRVEANPLRGSDGRTVTVNTALTAIIFPLYSQDMWGFLDQLFTSLAVDDPETALTLADYYNDREDGRYLSNSTEAFSAINCLDYPSPATLDREAMRKNAAALAADAPTIGRFQGYGDAGCFAWPAKGAETREAVTGAGAAPILVVGTTGDPATPYQWAEALAEQLESGVLVTYVGEGHTASTSSECVAKIVVDYFIDGTVPARDPRCS